MFKLPLAIIKKFHPIKTATYVLSSGSSNEEYCEGIMKKTNYFQKWLLIGIGSSMLTACSTMPSSGPSSRAVIRSDGEKVGESSIRIIELTGNVAQQVRDGTRSAYFADSLGDGNPIGSIIGKGDVLDTTIWEAPPATLFGLTGGDGRLAASNGSSRATSIPEQMVDSDGFITVPYVGRVAAAGRTPQDIAREVDRRLAGKAHLPQTIIRLTRNSTREVTVVGDIANSMRVPLTARGEKLLDILASAGGVRQPVGKMTIQITRGNRIASMPLEEVIRDPKQNIRLQPDDVVTAVFQPYSFTALGGTGRNDEVLFEGTGISLTQALGRVAGLQDARANVKGVFIFRLEDPDALSKEIRESSVLTPEGLVPVIYRVDMKNPATFFVAQNFPIRNRDVLYVSNAPLADIQKFVNVISSTILPVATASTIMP